MNEIISNDLLAILTQAIEEMKSESGGKINLAELERRTGITRQRLRSLQSKGFTNKTVKRKTNVYRAMDGYEAICNGLLKKGITNSNVHFRKLREYGYSGSVSSVFRYIAAHKDLVPAPRQLVVPQGQRSARYETEQGEAYQLDWGFTEIQCYDGVVYHAACLAMVCHHCGKFFVEFFPNAKQENLFIGMIHGFAYMGVPRYILTDNMKSVVIKRDYEGHPVWQKDYEAFMKTVGFATKLCKPRHPYTKGKVERLIRYVKSNFLAGRTFWNVTDLNEAALRWCEERNNTYKDAITDVPSSLHATKCLTVAHTLAENPELLFYLCPERKLSFDGFVNYEGRRFGVPFRYKGQTVRVGRDDHELRIYTPDLKQLLVTHEVTWSKRDRYCTDQFIVQPEEFPTSPVKTRIQMLPPQVIGVGFDKFNFDEEEQDE